MFDAASWDSEERSYKDLTVSRGDMDQKVQNEGDTYEPCNKGLMLLDAPACS